MKAAALLVLLAAPALAQDGPIEAVDTPQGLARVEGDPWQGGERLVVGDRVVLGGADHEPFLWIEAQAGTLLLVGIATGGTACPAEFVWVHTALGDERVTERFGTCSDLVEVTHDAETVTVTMPSGDAEMPRAAFAYDGRGPVRETALGQGPSGAPPEAGADAWIGRYPYELFQASDWRGPLVALMGEKGYALGQRTFERAAPMEADGDWVAGAGFHPLDGLGGAVAINRTDGRLVVVLRADGEQPRLWGDPGGVMPQELQAIMDAGDAP